jgi:hypothetical protein
MTNGYNEAVVLPALRRLGWVEPTLAKYCNILDEANRKSTSGRYFNDDSFHVVLKFENLYDMQNNKDISDCEMNDYIRQLVDSNILSALNKVVEAPRFIESALAFNRPEHTSVRAVSTDNGFRGLRIKVAAGEFGAQIKKAILFFDGEVQFPLYLFHSMTDGTEVVNNVTTDVTYLKKWTVKSKAKRQISVPLDQYIHYNNETVQGGHYFLGYFDADLQGVKPLDFSAYRHCYKLVNVMSFSSARIGNTLDFDRDTYTTGGDMYGLNAEIATFRDETQKIVNAAGIFDDLQGLMMAAKVIEVIYHSTRSHTEQRINKENIAFMYRDLNQVTTQDNPMNPGLKTQIIREAKRLNKLFYKRGGSQNIDL